MQLYAKKPEKLLNMRTSEFSKSLFTTIVLLFIVFNFLNAQDLIILKNGDEIKSKVIEIQKDKIKFRIFDDLTGAVKYINKKNVLLIKYQDGTNIVINSEVNTNVNNNTEIKLMDDETIKRIAIEDARKYYSPYSAICATSCLTASFPPLGAIAAIAINQYPPNNVNLKMPVHYDNNDIYVKHYTAEAYRVKKRKVWRSFGIYTAVYLPLFALLIQQSI